MEFLAYGALAEIFAKKTGFNRGMGGSMHAFCLFGVIATTPLSEDRLTSLSELRSSKK